MNASPSLSATTVSDRILKHKLLDDTMNIVCPDGELPDVKRKIDPIDMELGQYELLYDESLSHLAVEKDRRKKKAAGSGWK